MATQTFQTPEDKFKEVWLKIYNATRKAEEGFLALQPSSVIHKFPEVKRNFDLACQHLEDLQNRLHKVNAVLNEY